MPFKIYYFPAHIVIEFTNIVVALRLIAALILWVWLYVIALLLSHYNGTPVLRLGLSGGDTRFDVLLNNGHMLASSSQAASSPPSSRRLVSSHHRRTPKHPIFWLEPSETIADTAVTHFILRTKDTQ